MLSLVTQSGEVPSNKWYTFLRGNISKLNSSRRSLNLYTPASDANSGLSSSLQKKNSLPRLLSCMWAVPAKTNVFQVADMWAVKKRYFKDTLILKCDSLACQDSENIPTKTMHETSWAPGWESKVLLKHHFLDVNMVRKRHKNLELSLQIALYLRDSPGFSVTYRAGLYWAGGRNLEKEERLKCYWKEKFSTAIPWDTPLFTGLYFHSFLAFDAS